MAEEIQAGQEVQAAQDIYSPHLIPTEDDMPENPQLLNQFVAEYFPDGMGEVEIRRALLHILRGLVALKTMSPDEEPLITPHSVVVSRDGNQWKFQLVRGPSIPVGEAEDEARPTGIWGVGMLFLQMALGREYPLNLPPSKFQKVRENLFAILSFKIDQNKGYCKLHQSFKVYKSRNFRNICTTPRKLSRTVARRGYLTLKHLNVKEKLSFTTPLLDVVRGPLRTVAQHGNLGSGDERMKGLLMHNYFVDMNV